MQERIRSIKLKISIVLMQLWRLQMERGKLRLSLGLCRTQRTGGVAGQGMDKPILKVGFELYFV